MRGKKDILVKVNCPKEENDLRALQDKKSRIVVEMLKETYGEMILEEYKDSIRENKEKYTGVIL